MNDYIEPNASDTASHIAKTTADITLLREEFARLAALADRQKPLTSQLQVVMSRAITSPGEQNTEAVRNVQNQLDSAIDAHARLDIIRSQIKDLEGVLVHLAGRERSDRCNALKAEYEADFEDYKTACKNLLEQFNDLHRKSALYSTLTGSVYPLLPGNQLSLNLPPLNHEGQSMNTGRASVQV